MNVSVESLLKVFYILHSVPRSSDILYSVIHVISSHFGQGVLHLKLCATIIRYISLGDPCYHYKLWTSQDIYVQVQCISMRCTRVSYIRIYYNPRSSYILYQIIHVISSNFGQDKPQCISTRCTRVDYTGMCGN